jgi:predicted O-methyltransferase YrrM
LSLPSPLANFKSEIMSQLRHSVSAILDRLAPARAMTPTLSGPHHVLTGIRNGRNVGEGYLRGWGLQFGDLRSCVRRDPLYRAAYAAASDRTIMSEDNRLNIFLLLRFFLGGLPPGHIIEYGSYRGGSAIFMAHVAKKLHPGMKIYALDSYEGMPETDKQVDAHNAGDFADVDLDRLKARIKALQLDNLELVKGRFEDTHDQVMRSAGTIRLAHIDCDIASAVKFSYEGVKPHMVQGGYIVFDDATVSSCIGATEVVEDTIIRRDGMNSEQIWPHYVFRAFSDGA